MIRYCLFLLIVLSIVSCNEEKPQNLLIGDWKRVYLKGKPPDFPWGEPDGVVYTFINDTLVDKKQSFYKRFKNENEGYQEKFIGRVTKYKIEDYQLSFYDLSYSRWGKAKTYRLTNDTLFLIGANNSEEIFVKYKYVLGKEPHFNQIALSTSGCYGSCPIMNIIINSNGEVVFKGERYVDKLGIYTGSISKELFSKIENEFRKAKIETLNKRYSRSITDHEEVTTTFSHDDRIINSIHDYANAGPDELKWAYPFLRYLSQDIALTKRDVSSLPFYAVLNYEQIEQDDKFCWLSQSEGFLLQNYLWKGKVVQTKHEGKIQLIASNDYMREKKIGCCL